MSDKSEGPGWWIASDGNWYPPELHPSAVATSMHEVAQQQQQAEEPVRIGPQFPDLFQKAMEGSHLVDNVTVRSDLGDPGLPSSFTSVPVGRGNGGRTPVGAGTGGGGKWRRRKDR